MILSQLISLYCNIQSSKYFVYKNLEPELEIIEKMAFPKTMDIRMKRILENWAML